MKIYFRLKPCTSCCKWYKGYTINGKAGQFYRENNLHLFWLKAEIWIDKNDSWVGFLGNKTSRISDAIYMKELALRSKLIKRFNVATNSMHKYLIVPNVLNSEFSVTELSKAWIWDITYIWVEEGFLYLLIVLDSCDRKIIGWSLSDGLSAGKTSLAAWSMVFKIEVLKKFGISFWP
jgi:hypothetical protein